MKPTAVETGNQHTRRATLELSGVKYEGHDYDESTLRFVMPVVELNINYNVVSELLIAAGVDRERAMRYTDEMAEKVYVGELAQLLAKQITCIG